MNSKQNTTLVLINKSLPQLQKSYRTIRYLENTISRRNFWLYKLLFVLNNKSIGYGILGKKARVIFSDMLSLAYTIHTAKDESVDQHRSLLTLLEDYATATANIAEEFSRASFGLDRLYKEAGSDGLNYEGIVDPIWDPYREAVERSKVAETTFQREWNKWKSLLKHTQTT
jgi:hypothetical protein